MVANLVSLGNPSYVSTLLLVHLYAKSTGNHSVVYLASNSEVCLSLMLVGLSMEMIFGLLI